MSYLLNSNSSAVPSKQKLRKCTNGSNVHATLRHCELQITHLEKHAKSTSPMHGVSMHCCVTEKLRNSSYAFQFQRPRLQTSPSSFVILGPTEAALPLRLLCVLE